MKRVAVLGLLVVVATIFAMSQTAPRRVVVRAGKVLDVKTGQTASNQAITIEGDKIVSIGPAGNVASEGATIIDLPNATVLPGLIDSHTHITFDPKGLGYESLGISVPREALTSSRP